MAFRIGRRGEAMEWRWQWFFGGVAGLLGLGLLRGLLKILSPVAVVGVMAYGLGILWTRRRPDGQQRLPASAPANPPAKAPAGARAGR